MIHPYGLCLNTTRDYIHWDTKFTYITPRWCEIVPVLKIILILQRSGVKIEGKGILLNSRENTSFIHHYTIYHSAASYKVLTKYSFNEWMNNGWKSSIKSVLELVILQWIPFYFNTCKKNQHLTSCFFSLIVKMYAIIFQPF